MNEVIRQGYSLLGVPVSDTTPLFTRVNKLYSILCPTTASRRLTQPGDVLHTSDSTTKPSGSPFPVGKGMSSSAFTPTTDIMVHDTPPIGHENPRDIHRKISASTASHYGSAVGTPATTFSGGSCSNLKDHCEGSSASRGHNTADAGHGVHATCQGGLLLNHADLFTGKVWESRQECTAYIKGVNFEFCNRGVRCIPNFEALFETYTLQCLSPKCR